MIQYVLLLAIVVLIFHSSLRMSKFELMSPVPLMLLGLAVSVLLSIIGLLSWNSICLSVEVVCIVSVGSLGILSGGFVYQRINQVIKNKAVLQHRSKDDTEDARTIGGYTYRGVPLPKIILLGFFVVTAICLRVYETYEIAKQMGISISDYSAMAAEVRQATESFISADALRLDVGFSFIERQLEKIVWAVGFVAAYLIARAIIERNKRQIAYAVALMLSTWVFYILAGGRGTIMYHIIAIFTVVSILKYAEPSIDPKGFFKKLVTIGLCSAILCAVGLYAASYLVGRGASSGAVDYVSFYFGGSVPSLELLIETQRGSIIPGINTFYYLFSPLYKLGVIDTYPNYSLLWVNLGGYASNIFTCFARYYMDFGLLGVFILSALSVQIPLCIYNWARNRLTPLALVTAGYLSPFLFDCAREEFIFSRLISTSQLFNLIVIIMVTVYVSYNIPSLVEGIKKHLSFILNR